MKRTQYNFWGYFKFVAILKYPFFFSYFLASLTRNTNHQHKKKPIPSAHTQTYHNQQKILSNESRHQAKQRTHCDQEKTI